MELLQRLGLRFLGFSLDLHSFTCSLQSTFLPMAMRAKEKNNVKKGVQEGWNR